MNQRLLVTGGRGTLGKKLVPLLQQAGGTVRISSRNPQPGDHDENIEWVQASLESPSGWVEAVMDVDTIVHLASTPFKRGVDVAGTRHLLDAAKSADVKHIVFISIVGVDKRDWFFYTAKHDCEKLIADSGLPFSILRATQFHDFVHMLLNDIFLRSAIGFLPRGWRIQPIDSGEVAGLLFDAVRQRPSGRLPDAGGPEILTVKEIAATWTAVMGQRRIISIPFPILMGKAFGPGHNLAPDQRVGRITWADWVAQNLAKAPKDNP
ncbi:MAG: SDR family oxidoreductase [Candidatus Promineifilaceae bacterium]|nr:SDR family oxidoreductase [Candidatus Promineifilaceae bacterium]